VKTLLVYLDTSVLGGCFDPEFAPWSRGLIQDLGAGRYRPVLSTLLADEMARAPARVRALFAEVLALAPLLLETTPEVELLVRAYEAHAILPARFRADMVHIALATAGGADVLVSWNFRYIVRLDKIRLFNAVNAEQGYRTLAIHSPREVTTYDRDRGEDTRDGG